MEAKQTNERGDDQKQLKAELISLKTSLRYLFWTDDGKLSQDPDIVGTNEMSLNKIVQKCPTLVRDIGELKRQLSTIEYLSGEKLNSTQVDVIAEEIQRRNNPEDRGQIIRKELKSALSKEIQMVFAAARQDKNPISLNEYEIEIAMQALEDILDDYKVKLAGQRKLSDKRE